MIELKTKYSKIEVNEDSFNDNPDFIIEINLKMDEKSIDFKYKLFEATPQVATLYGLKIGLKKLLKNYSKSPITVKVNKYCNTIFVVKNGTINKNMVLIDKIKYLIQQFDDIYFQWVKFTGEIMTAPTRPVVCVKNDDYKIKSLQS